MEKLIYRIKSAKFTKIFIFKAFLCAFLLIFYIFVYLNQYDIIFFSNGFGEVLNCKMQIYMLDVGQATSFCVITPDKNVWILDTGSQDCEDEFIAQVDIILRKNNLHKIDYLLLSHSDEDHVGGAVALLKQRDVKHIFRPKIYSDTEEKSEDWKAVENSKVYSLAIKYAYAEANCEVIATEDKVLNFSDYSVSIFATENTTRKETNSYCPFVLFSYANRKFLFTGDATQARENEFLDDIKEQKVVVDFLQVAHHGSNSSSTEKFLNAIKPKVALVSAGDSGYPHSEVVKRLYAAGMEKMYVTQKEGLLGIGIGLANKVCVARTKNGIDIPLFAVVVSLFVFVVLGFDFSNQNKKFYDLFLTRKNIL